MHTPPTKLTEADARRSLHDHLLEKAARARERYGPRIDADAILKILSDPDFIRYPTGIRFDSAGLEPGEFGYPMPLGDHPSRGFCLVLHPSFEHRRQLWPTLIAYHIPPINYGEIASPEDCEQFAAALLGVDIDTYYDTLCSLVDSIPGQVHASGSTS
ncbi:hypothetical protein PHYC_00736 [Phycisphaerales bacterium]|nr:hypothetical protein PHYC_00736 [Phycisphaerales bacterium]